MCETENIQASVSGQMDSAVCSSSWARALSLKQDSCRPSVKSRVKELRLSKLHKQSVEQEFSLDHDVAPLIRDHCVLRSKGTSSPCSSH